MKLAWFEVAALSASVTSASSLAYSPPYYPSPWMTGEGEWSEAYTRAVEFVSNLTLAEKVNLTTGAGWEQERCVGETGGIPRLGMWGMCMQDSPLGVRSSDYTSGFPSGVNVAAAWDKRLAYQRGVAMGEEHRDKGVDVQLGPVAGPLGKNPDGGRNWEGFSPDPVLTGVMMAETIKGMQDAGIIACAKHFIGNEQEHFRQSGEAQGYGYNISQSVSSNIDDKTMHELYLWPFVDSIRAGVGSVMCSYNQINNSYSCANSYSLNKLLKGELGFQGFVMSDWGAHHSGVESALAGLDMSMPGDVILGSPYSYWGTNLTISVLNGTVPEWRLDDMAVRIMSAYYKVGRDRFRTPPNFSSWTRDEYNFEHSMVSEGWGKVNERVNVQRDHAQIIRKIGSDSIVLLKNKAGALPLTHDERFIGIIGEDAGSNAYGANGCSDRGCDNGTLAMGWGSGTANFPYLITPEQAIQNEVVEYSNGQTNVFAVTDNWALTEMAALASQADVALVFVNADSGEGYINVDGNEGDRKNLTLWKNGEEVIKAASQHCNNTIVVIHSTSAVLISDWYDNVNITAIVWAGLPGQESGRSLVDVLYGRVNPGGKTPFTWGKTRKDYGPPILTVPNNGVDAPQVNFEDGVFIDYRRFDKDNTEPIYEFGYGLSYTNFAFSDLKVTPLASSEQREYKATTGKSQKAPVLGEAGKVSDNLFPEGITRVRQYLYPWLNSTDLRASSGDPDYGMDSKDYLPEGATDGSPQDLLPSSGSSGGNPGLFEDLYQVTATITNTGSVTGDEVPQLYVSLGGDDNPSKVLRQFDRVTIAPGQTLQWTTTLTRRDVSNWDVASQNWVISDAQKKVYVGNSSRKLPLSADLPSVE
ncbi:CAZyme family GH3 [Penicillium psychrosexuale]|uniref:CAZyme family GH3 n=1 Tax=Penicillium psychrosexuale TaxID=1002107 RepID=UPI0025454141|nr:CAZyme family GH3 [Penicillium psychrosexuale]KAJ5795455.1 CAZyme family GH3 [Penicillium psychrosexuale]